MGFKWFHQEMNGADLWDIELDESEVEGTNAGVLGFAKYWNSLPEETHRECWAKELKRLLGIVDQVNAELAAEVPDLEDTAPQASDLNQNGVKSSIAGVLEGPNTDQPGGNMSGKGLVGHLPALRALIGVYHPGC